MRAVATLVGRLLLAGVATCAVATCQHDSPVPVREAPPMGAPPEHTPAAPLAPRTRTVAPARTIDAGLPAPTPATSLVDQIRSAQQAAFATPPDDDSDADAQPAAVAPKTPPLDAGLDGPINLPPVPDAGALLRDAGTPMTN